MAREQEQESNAKKSSVFDVVLSINGKEKRTNEERTMVSISLKNKHREILWKKALSRPCNCREARHRLHGSFRSMVQTEN